MSSTVNYNQTTLHWDNSLLIYSFDEFPEQDRLEDEENSLRRSFDFHWAIGEISRELRKRIKEDCVISLHCDLQQKFTASIKTTAGEFHSEKNDMTYGALNDALGKFLDYTPPEPPKPSFSILAFLKSMYADQSEESSASRPVKKFLPNDNSYGRVLRKYQKFYNGGLNAEIYF